MTPIKRKWHDEIRFEVSYEYRRKFAIFPIKLNKIIIFKHYYKKYKIVKDTSTFHDYDYCYTEYEESITEEEYLCRKLAGNLDK